jgi:hypothetical protein
MIDSVVPQIQYKILFISLKLNIEIILRCICPGANSYRYDMNGIDKNEWDFIRKK